MTQSPDSFQFRTEDAERSSSSGSSGTPDVHFDDAGEGRELAVDTTINFDVEDAPAPSQAHLELLGSPPPQPPPTKKQPAFASPSVSASVDPQDRLLPPVAPSRNATSVAPAVANTPGAGRESPDASPSFRSQLSRHSEGSICFEDQPLSQTQVSTPLQAVHDTNDNNRCAASSPELAVPTSNDPAPGQESTATADELMNIDSDPPTSKKSGSPRKPLKPAQHPTEWVSRTVASPHHALYQPGRVKEIDEDAFVKQHPFWNRPKGASASRCGSSADGEGNQPQQGLPTLSSPLDVRSRVRNYMDTIKKPRLAESSRKTAPNSVAAAPAGGEVANESQAVATAEAGSRPAHLTKQSPEAAEADDRVHQWLHLQPPSSGGGSHSATAAAAAAADHATDIKVSPRSDDGRATTKTHKADGSSSMPRHASRTTGAQQHQQSSQKSHRASSATKKAAPTTSDGSTVAALEAKRRQLVLLYGSKRGLELFAKFKEHYERDRGGAAVRSDSKGAQVTASKLTPRGTDGAGAAASKRTDATSTPRDQETVWNRLYSAHIRHPSHSPSRDQTVSLGDVKANRSASTGSAKGVHDGLTPRGTANHDEVFSKLYRCGMDELNKRKKLFQDGQYKKLEREMTESLEAVIAARIMRRPDGHKPMTRGELEATVAAEKTKFLERLRASYDAAAKKAADVANESGQPADDARLTPRKLDALPTVVPLLSFSPELRLTRDEIDDLSSRLYRHKVRKFAEEEKMKEHLELAQCTFRPAINHYRSASPMSTVESARPTSAANAVVETAKDAAEPRSSRSSSANRCLALYAYAKRDQKSQMALKERLEEKRRADILQSKLDSDHHFRRRVASDPSLAKKFMESLRV